MSNVTQIDDLENDILDNIDIDIDLLDDEVDDEVEFEVDDTPEEAVSPVTMINDLEEEEEEEEDIGEKRNPILKFMGQEYDRDSAVVFGTIIVIWVLIWATSGLWKTLKYEPTFSGIFFLFIFYMLLQIHTSGTSSGGVVYELNILLTVEQMISILFGTIVVFTLFSHYLRDKLNVHENCMKIIFKLSISTIIILTAASLWINVWTSGQAFRAVRKFKQGIYNVSLTLFIIIGLIIYKGADCT